MSNPSKARGTAAETKVVEYLRANGWPHAERRALSGRLDKGDIAIPALVVEVKDVRTESWSTWLNETLIEQNNAKADFGFCFRRRIGRPNVGDWYALTTVAQQTRLLRLAGYGEPVE